MFLYTPQFPPPPRRAFTLVELLLVVVIIAVLAAMAVPNVTVAGPRAKVSRAKADMRSLATALESYRVDEGVYPPARPDYAIPHQLSTPVEYIRNYAFNDPFTPNDGKERSTLRYYVEGESWVLVSVGPNQQHEVSLQRYVRAENKRREIAPDWSLGDPVSNGRLESLYTFSAEFLNAQYDPTNGTISEGDIIRSHLGQYH